MKNDKRNRVSGDRFRSENNQHCDAAEETGIVAGRNAVRELIRSSQPIDKILVSGKSGQISSIIAEAKEAGIPIIPSADEKLDRISCGAIHQGIVAYAAQKEYSTVDEILAIAKDRGELPLIAIADCVEDPHNLGSLIRCAECAGAHGVIIPRRRSCGLTPVVAKSSAGALFHMAVAKVGNIAQTIDYLKEQGVWTFAAEAGGDPYYETDFKLPAAIVFGSEGTGVARLVRESCDFTVSIPMYGHVNSLNVSTAASVILCHAARIQRT